MKVFKVIGKVFLVLWFVAMNLFVVGQVIWNRQVITEMDKMIDQINFLTDINTPAR